MKPRAWLAPASILVAACVLLLPIAFGDSFWSKDILRYTYPQKAYLRERLLHGEIPLWWSHLGLGRPFFGLVQPGVLYPGNLVLLALPMPLAYDVFSALHFLVAAFGMRAWLRRSDCEDLEATFGGVLFAASGYFVSLLSNNGVYAFGLAWVPAILAAAASDAPRARKVGVVALLLALCLSTGDPQAVFFAGIALVMQGIASRNRTQSLVTVALAAIVAGVIGLVVLVPGAEVAALGRPNGVPLEDAHHFALHPFRLVEMLWPGAYGAPYSPNWFISPLVDEGAGVRYMPLAAGIYLGLATPFFALAALVNARRNRLDVAVAALAFFTLLLAFGRYAPVWEPFFRFVPAAKSFRYPEKYFAVTTLCLAYLAARGLSVVVLQATRAAKIGLIVLAALAAFALGSFAFGPSLVMFLVGRVDVVAPEAVLRERALFALALGLISWLPIRWAATGRLTALRLRLALATIVACDLLLASVHLIDWAPSSIYRTRSTLIDDLPMSAGGRPPLRLYRPNELQLTESSALFDHATLLPDSGVEDGIDHLDAYDVFHTPAEEALWSTMRSHPVRLLQVTATSFAIVGDSQLGTLPPALQIRVRYPSLHASLVHIDGAADRVYLAEHTRVVDDALAAARAMLSPDFIPGTSAVIEAGESREAQGHCVVDFYAPEHVTLRCTASAPSYAVLAEASFPGWEAHIGGASVPVLRANAAMRAVPVPAGDSVVELRYRPRGLVPAACASFVALLLATFLAVSRPRGGRLDRARTG